MKIEYENWDDLKKKYFSAQEIEEAEKKADLICALINARKEKHMTQKQLEEVTGIKQPVIARLENGRVSSQIGTLLKILSALGKTLKIVDAKKPA